MKKSDDTKKKYFIIGIAIILIIVIILLLLSSCGKGLEVEFDVDGNVYLTQKLHKGDKLEDVEEPKKKGYTFEGWYLDGEKYPLDQPIEEDITLEAVFSKNKYTVTFGDESGEENSQTIEYGDKLTKPEDPTKEDYAFLGWFDGDTEYDFNEPVTGDLDLTPKWVKNKASYTVEHYLMGLDGKYSDKAYKKEKFKGTIGKTVKPAVKSFKGFTSPSIKVIEGLEDNKLIIKYYYERNKYDVTITGDKGILEVTGSGKYYYGEDVKISAVVKDGYTFKKWSNGTKNLTFTYNVSDNNAKFEALTNVNTYDISYELNGGTLNNKNNNYTVEDEITFEIPSKLGYTFTGWLLDGKEFDGTIKAGTTGDLNVEATFKPNEDTKYVIQYYLMDTTGENYILDETRSVNKTGTTDTKIEYTPEDIEGFAKPVLKDQYNQEVDLEDLVIEADESTVLKYYYERNKYDLTIKGDFGVLETVGSGNYYYDSEVEVSATLKDGYSLVKWSNEKTDLSFTYTIGAENSTLEVITKADDNIPYTVEHYLMDLDGEHYSLKDTDNLIGTTDTTVTPSVKTYEGFTAPNEESVKVVADGSAIVKYYYERNKYDLDLTFDKGIESVSGDGEYYFEQEIVLSYQLKPGYSFKSYSEEVENNVFKMPADDVTINLESTPNSDTKYIVKHYKMNLNGNYENVEPEIEELQGTTDTSVTPNVKEYTGFTAPEKVTVNINGDGSTIVEYKYSRNKYDLTINYINTRDEKDTEGVKSITSSGSHYYGETVTADIELLEGFDFVEWSNKDTNTSTSYVMTATNNQTLTASIKRHTYKVNFNSRGTKVGSIEVFYGKKVTKPTDPTRDGYDFVGWFTESNGNTSWDFEKDTMPSNDITLYAKWNIHRNTVTFEANGGRFADGEEHEDVPRQSVGSQIAEPEEPTREGYNFAGWYESIDGTGEKWDFDNNTMPDNALILYAKWDVVNYTVNYENDDYAIDNPSSYNIENEYELKTPSKEGYSFVNWTITLSDGSTMDVDNKIPKGLFGDITLKANFKANEYILEYHDNNSDNEEPVRKSVTYDSYFELINNPFHKIYTITYNYNYNYGNVDSGSLEVPATFLCWSKSIDGECIDEELRNFASNDGDVVKLYAKWTSSNAELQIPSRTGYQFSHWNNQNGKIDNQYTVSKDETLTATWIANKLMINYYKDAQQSEPKNEEVNYEKYNLKPGNTYSKDYYITYNYNHDNVATGSQIVPATFLCWSKTVDGTCFSEEDLKKELENPNIISIDLYPRWTDSTTTLESPSRVGYQFSNWKDLNGNVKDNSNYKLNGDMVLTAIWTPNDYFVTLYPNGANEEKEYTLDFKYDSSQVLENRFTRRGYTFVGWSQDPKSTKPEFTDKEEVKNLTKENKGNVEFYAVWTPIEYIVRYHENNGDGENKYVDVTYKFDEKFNLKTAEDEDLKFKKTYTVKYNTNYPSNMLSYDKKETLKETLVKNNFNGWKNKEGTKTYDTSQINMIDQEGAIIDLYADWSNPSFTPHTLNDITDYRFKGYNSDIDSIGFISKDTSATITGDVELTAKWNLIPYITDFGFDIYKDDKKTSYGINPIVKGDHTFYVQLPLDSMVKPVSLKFAFNTKVNLQEIKSNLEKYADITYSQGSSANISIEGMGIDVETTDYQTWKGYRSSMLDFANLTYTSPDTLFDYLARAGSLTSNYEFYIPAGFAKTSDDELSEAYVTHRVKANGSWWLFFAKEGAPTVNVTFVNASDGNRKVLEFKNVVYKGNKTPNVGKVADGQNEFVGWFKDEKMTIPYDFNDILSDNVTVYGKYDEPHIDIDETWYDESKESFDICSKGQLIGFANLVDDGKTFANKTVNLVCDINMEGINWTAVQGFKGHFNGNYHIIKNLNVTTPANDSYNTQRLGFFAQLTGSNIIIENIKFESPTVSNKTVDGVGVVAGKIDSSVKVSRILINGGTVEGKQDVGGIVGRLEGGTITEIQTNKLKINTTQGGDTGGIVGYGSKTNILNNLIVIDGSITSISDRYVDTGGIIGDQDKGSLKMNNVIFTGSISGVSNFFLPLGTVGGITARYDGANLDGSNDLTWFYDSVINLGVGSVKGKAVAHSKDELKKVNTYDSSLWDFGKDDSIWSITEGSYPVLKWTLKNPLKSIN